MKFRVIAIAYVTWVLFSVVVVCGAHDRGMYVLKKRDNVRDLETSETSASGYIYRTDGQSPPVFIKLGEGKNEKFDAILENFKKENGFHEMPSVFAGSHESPYNIPVVGQEKMVDHGDHGGILGYNARSNSQFGDSVDNFDSGMEDLESFSDFGGDHHYFDNNDGKLDTRASPFKYHHDVSSNGLKGDSLGFDDQNYFGSPFTHSEHKTAPHHPKHHSKSGGSSFEKAGHYYAKGASGDSGHKHQHGFDKGHAGKYDKDDLKGHYKKASGYSVGHADTGDHYGKHSSGAHGAKGHKFGDFESHKKGQKTTGFHNVYHKDEYNKEQMFYDNAHKQGKHERYDGKHRDYAHADGGHKHGKHHATGYDDTHKSGVGTYAKGGYHDGHRGHSGEFGHKSHHDHKAEYDTMSDNKKFGEQSDLNGGGVGGDDFY